MTLPREKLREGCRRLALTAFAGFLIASATQAACTATVASGPPSEASCGAGETAKKLGFAGCRANLDVDIPPFHIAEIAKSSAQLAQQRARVAAIQHADNGGLLLRRRGKRP